MRTPGGRAHLGSPITPTRGVRVSESAGACARVYVRGGVRPGGPPAGLEVPRDEGRTPAPASPQGPRRLLALRLHLPGRARRRHRPPAPVTTALRPPRPATRPGERRWRGADGRLPRTPLPRPGLAGAPAPPGPACGAGAPAARASGPQRPRGGARPRRRTRRRSSGPGRAPRAPPPRSTGSPEGARGVPAPEEGPGSRSGAASGAEPLPPLPAGAGWGSRRLDGQRRRGPRAAMGEEQSTVSGGGASPEARPPASGVPGPHESPRPRGDLAGAPGPRTASAEPNDGGCRGDLGCVDPSTPEPARTLGAPGRRKSPAAGQPAGLALPGPLNPQTLQQQLEEEEEEAGDRNEEGDEQQEAPPGEEQEPRTRAGAPDQLVLDVLAPRRPLSAKRQVFCSVFCVENDLPEVPTAEQLSPPALPPRAPPVTNPPSTPSSFPSPRLSHPADPLSPDGGSIELEFYLAPEPFSVPSLLGAPPYSGLGGVGDAYAPLMVLMCRVCLEDKPIKPLPCCKKAVCEECLKVYLSSQVTAPPLSPPRVPTPCSVPNPRRGSPAPCASCLLTGSCDETPLPGTSISFSHLGGCRYNIICVVCPHG